MAADRPFWIWNLNASYHGYDVVFLSTLHEIPQFFLIECIEYILGQWYLIGARIMTRN